MEGTSEETVAGRQGRVESGSSTDRGVALWSVLLRVAMFEFMAQHPFCKVVRSVGAYAVRLTYNCFFKCKVVKSVNFLPKTNKMSIRESRVAFEFEAEQEYRLVE